MGALNTDYRPNSFDEFIGGKTIIKSLKSILKRDKADIPHAFLFSGSSGCGKTTLARILAKELGCPETNDGKSNIDFAEINTANNRGIETARDILSNVHFKPFSSSCRVYLLDEVHMATRDFQNSFLKVLEDSPKHVYFMLCTTEPKKIIPTIRNRCSHYEVQPLNDPEMSKLLSWVTGDIGLDLHEDVRHEIIDVAEGCPRQALTILDQIVDMPADDMLAAIKGVNLDDTDIRELCQEMLNNNSWGDIAKILKGIKNHEPEKIRQTVINYMKSVCLGGGQSSGQAALIFDCFRELNYHNGFAGIVFSAYNVTTL